MAEMIGYVLLIVLGLIFLFGLSYAVFAFIRDDIRNEKEYKSKSKKNNRSLWGGKYHPFILKELYERIINRYRNIF